MYPKLKKKNKKKCSFVSIDFYLCLHYYELCTFKLTTVNYSVYTNKYTTHRSVLLTIYSFGSGLIDLPK